MLINQIIWLLLISVHNEPDDCFDITTMMLETWLHAFPAAAELLLLMHDGAWWQMTHYLCELVTKPALVLLHLPQKQQSEGGFVEMAPGR